MECPWKKMGVSFGEEAKLDWWNLTLFGFCHPCLRIMCGEKDGHNSNGDRRGSELLLLTKNRDLQPYNKNKEDAQHQHNKQFNPAALDSGPEIDN